MYTQLLKITFAPLLGLTFCLSLCACSTTSETFDCPPGKGVGCKSITEVNQMVNRGTMGGNVEEGAQSIPEPSSASIMAAASLNVENSESAFGDKAFLHQADASLSDEFFVQRIQEEHLRVWIAPFQDAQGNLHEGSIVHTVLKPGSWRVLRSQESESGTEAHASAEPGNQPDHIEGNVLARAGVHSSESEEYS